MKKIIQGILVLVSLLISMPPGHATDGYFALGYGALQKSLAGAGVSMYHVSLIGGNPAGNAYLGKGYFIDVGLFNPIRSYTIIGNPSGQPNSFGLMQESVESENNFFLIPAIGANWKLGDQNAIAIAIYGNGGMNTDYPNAAFYDESSPNSTGVDLAQLFAEFTFAHKISENHALGVSAILGYQLFAASGLNAFGQFGMSSDPAKLSNNDKETSIGFGFKVGYQGEIVENLRIGGMFQSKIYMSEFDDYAGLFAEDGDFDIPVSWTVGLSYTINETFTVMADFKQILYSGVNAVANPMNPQTLFPGYIDQNGQQQLNPAFVPLGHEDGAGFGWEDMSVIKVGFEYSGVSNWTFRGGYSYGAQPIPESEVMFNILAPGVVENHIALGFSRSLGQGNAVLHFSVNHALNNSIVGVNPLDPGQSIELEMKQFDFNVGISF